MFSQQKGPFLKEQQGLIKVLNEERKDNERRFHTLIAKSESESAPAPADASASHSSTIEPPPSQQTPDEEAGNEKVENEEAGSESSKAKGRVWIRDESPEREDQPTKKTSSLLRKTSLLGRVSSKVRGRGRIPNRFVDEQGDDDEEDDSSLLDMASFLKSTGPDTPRDSGEDAFSLPILPTTSSPKHKARDPIVRGDTSDLINFFKDASPRIRRNPSTKKLQKMTSIRHISGPITPPLTGREDMEKSPPVPPKVSPVQPLLRSQSAKLPSPLGSHPPEPQIDPSRPATNKWPLQAVLAWLEQNSFSPEWQNTFRVLQVQGSEFVELESGQSIRKMLTVIYPQLAKECSESGKGWDQSRERAEGNRLRKLIRELPVAIKYEDGESSTPQEESSTTRPTTQPPPDREMTSPGRRRAATTPAEDTTPRPPPSNEATGTKHTEIFTLSESDEEEHSNANAMPRAEKVADHGSLIEEAEPETSSVSDEWVKRWTILSAEEIARGRQEEQQHQHLHGQEQGEGRGAGTFLVD
jgi:hypothetical protein